MRGLYRYLLRPLLELLAWLAAWFRPRLRAALAGRREARRTLDGIPPAPSDALRLWVHAPSLGELLLVEEAVRVLASAVDRPLALLITVTSPSALERARQLTGAHYAAFLPPDSTRYMRRLLARFAPAIVLVSQYDLWPNMVWSARDEGVPVVLVGGLLRPGSGKLGWPARLLYRQVYGALSLAAAVSAEDAARLRALGVPPEALEVTGDPRFDRVARLSGEEPPGLLPDGRRWIVAGSTWPPDEARLLLALARLKGDHLDAGLAVAPHELSEDRLVGIEAAAAGAGLACTRLSRLEAGQSATAEVLLVDRFGVLVVLYAEAEIAYVGGGFGSGLHNVLEPAAHGKPVLFGPKYARAREAVLLASRGAARPVREAEDLGLRLSEWLDDEDARRRAGAAARGVIAAERGAARRTVEALLGGFPGLFAEARDPETADG